jgi:hypothetical protein
VASGEDRGGVCGGDYYGGGVGAGDLANRPSLGFTADQNKELTNAKTLDALHKKVEAERTGFAQRHAENLQTLAKKHLLWRRDTVLELQKFQESTPELERAAREAQVTLAGRALKKAEVPWCVTGQMVVDYLLKDAVTADIGVVLAVERPEDAATALKGAGFKLTKEEGGMRVSGLYGLDMRVATDAASRELPKRASKGTVPGTSLQGLQMAKDEDVFDWKVACWRDATRGESVRRKDLSDLKRLIQRDNSMRKRLPEELRKELK